MSIYQEILIIVSIGCIAGSISNAISPRGVAWHRNIDDDVLRSIRAVGIPVVDLAEMKRRVSDSDWVVCDARSKEDFQFGHITKAISLPAQSIAEAFSELRALLSLDQRIAVYCSGRQCGEALKVATFLKEQGFREVVVFLGGIREWRQEKLPEEVGE